MGNCTKAARKPDRYLFYSRLCDPSSDLEKLLAENERQMQEMQQTWQQRLEAARKEWEAEQHKQAETQVSRHTSNTIYIGIVFYAAKSLIVENLFGLSLCLWSFASRNLPL